MIAPPPDQTAAQRLPVIHVGMPKTATKTLQMCLFARHSEVEFLGTYTGKKTRFSQCRDAQIEQLINQLLWKYPARPDLPLCRDIYRRAVAPALGQGLAPVWSWESLIENHYEVQKYRAENLRAVFGDCRIIVTIRHPVKLVESLYLQLLKRDNLGARYRLGKQAVYKPIESWITGQWGQEGHAPNVHLEYAQGIKLYADIFGADRVGVFLFEQLIKEPEAYYRSLCQFIGINADEALQHVLGENENQRWTETQLKRLRTVSSSWLEGLRFRFSSRKQRRQMLGLLPDGSIPETDLSPSAKEELPEEWRKRIFEKTRVGNQHLMKQWGVPLDQYNYPL